MPKTNVFIPSSGTTQSIDNQQFDIKFNKTVQKLNDGLTKSQHALGLFYDKNRQLSDAMGRCVEGLSLWQIRLGMWIDETGKARTVAGGYAEGLSRTELELGFYADELGKFIIDKTKSFVKPKMR